MPSAAVAAASQGNRLQAGPRQLWKFGQDVNYISHFAAKADVVRARTAQFDGFCFQTPSHNPIRSTAMTLADARSAFSGLAEAAPNWGGMKYAPMVYWFEEDWQTQNPWTVDADWVRIAQNWANYAQAAYEAGCSLLMFDNEAYGIPATPWQANPFPYDYPNCAPSLTLAEARTLARARGEQVMDAVRAAVPHATVVLLHPMGISSPNYTNYLLPAPFNDVSAVHELNGVFHSGFHVSAAKPGSAAKTVDGGEVYTLRSVEEFEKLNRWAKYWGRVVDDTTAPIASVTPFRAIAGITLFDANDRVSPTTFHTPAEVKDKLINAMRVAETYTIFYTESWATGDWWQQVAGGTGPGGDGRVTQAMLDAVAEAKVAGKGGVGIGGSGGGGSYSTNNADTLALTDANSHTYSGGGSSFSDTFTGANGAAWATPWTTSTGGAGAVVDIQGNRGRMVTSSTADLRAGAYYGTLNNGEVLIKASFPNPSTTHAYMNVLFRTDGTWSGNFDFPNNGYYLDLVPSDNAAYIYRWAAGSPTQIGSASYTFTNGVDVWIRLRWDASTIQARLWNVGTTEPTTWSISITDSTRTTGSWGLSASSATTASKTVYWDDLSGTVL